MDCPNKPMTGETALAPVAERWNFLSQAEYDQLPIASWFDVQGRVILNLSDLPAHLKPATRGACCSKFAAAHCSRDPASEAARAAERGAACPPACATPTCLARS